MKRLMLTALLSASLVCTAQSGFEAVDEIKLPPTEAFNVDQFGNIYVIYNDEIKKLNPEAKELHSYSQPILGEIHSVDVLNPMAPYVFYKNTNRLVVVDNRLNESSQINFNDYDFFDVQFISFSDQENVWFYDQSIDKLFRFNTRQKRSTNQTLNLTQIVGKENQPRGMVSTIDNVYLNIPEYGIYVFNATGSLIKVLSIKGVTDFDVEDDRLFAIKDGGVKIYDLKTGQSLPVLFSENQLQDLEYSNKRLYLFDGKKLKVYRHSGK